MDLRRHFRISGASLARGIDAGITAATLAAWFPRRTGAELTPAVRLMLLAAASRVGPVTAERPLVLRTTSAEVLDGLVQHPETASLLGERLGPTAVMVPDANLRALRDALGWPQCPRRTTDLAVLLRTRHPVCNRFGRSGSDFPGAGLARLLRREMTSNERRRRQRGRAWSTDLSPGGPRDITPSGCRSASSRP